MFEVLGRLLYFLLHLSIDKSLSSGDAHPLMRRSRRQETKMPDPKDMTSEEIAALLVTDAGVSVETLGGNPIRPGTDRWEKLACPSDAQEPTRKTPAGQQSAHQPDCDSRPASDRGSDRACLRLGD